MGEKYSPRKRCSEHAAYAGGLVGITLEVDEATLHKPEYARILLGCREVKKIPPSAEGMLGEQFYDFFYEVEKVVSVGGEKNQTSIAVDSGASPSVPKKARVDSYPASSMEQGDTDASMVGNQSSQNYDKNYQILAVVSENEEEEDSDKGNHTELLIESMAREHDKRNVSYYDSPVNNTAAGNIGDEMSCEDGGILPANRKGAWEIIQTPIPPTPMFL